MENKRLKKYLLLFSIALTVVAVASFRLSHQVPKSAPASLIATARLEQLRTEKPKAENDAKELIPVSRVIDGDTVVVNINGAEVHIRLIGINSPELNDKRAQVACFAKKAKDEAEKLLDGSTSLTTGGKNIYLEKDPTQGDYDKYGRLLAYVFLGDGTSFNKLMIEKGYAYEYTYRLPYKYQAEFKTAQEEARAAQKGLWGKEICPNPAT